MVLCRRCCYCCCRPVQEGRSASQPWVRAKGRKLGWSGISRAKWNASVKPPIVRSPGSCGKLLALRWATAESPRDIRFAKSYSACCMVTYSYIERAREISYRIIERTHGATAASGAHAQTYTSSVHTSRSVYAIGIQRHVQAEIRGGKRRDGDSDARHRCRCTTF